MSQNSTGKVTLGDLRTKGLLDLHRQGTTWVTVIRLRDGRLTNLALEESITTRKAALQFLKAELSKLELVDDCKNKRYMMNFLDESRGGQD